MNSEMIGAMIAALTIIGGGILTLLKVMSTLREEKEEESEKMLTEAKNYTDNKYIFLQSELEHHKEMHESKISELTRKIEDLRDDLKKQHFQLVELLTRMIESNNK